MAEAYLKRLSGVHGIAAESVLTFPGTKNIETQYKFRKKHVCVCVYVVRWREKPVCLAKLQHYQKHQKYYNAIEKSKIIHWQRCQSR